MYPNGTVPTGSGRYMEDECHSTRRLGKMKSKMIMSPSGLEGVNDPLLIMEESCIKYG